MFYWMPCHASSHASCAQLPTPNATRDMYPCPSSLVIYRTLTTHVLCLERQGQRERERGMPTPRVLGGAAAAAAAVAAVAIGVCHSQYTRRSKSIRCTRRGRGRRHGRLWGRATIDPCICRPCTTGVASPAMPCAFAMAKVASRSCPAPFPPPLAAFPCPLSCPPRLHCLTPLSPSPVFPTCLPSSYL